MRERTFGVRRSVLLLAGLLLLSLLPGLSAQSAAPRGAPPPAAPDAKVLDLNTASIADLRRLPGVGDEYAKRIVEGRPYTAKNQLVTRGVLPQDAYLRIKDSVVAHRPPRK